MEASQPTGNAFVTVIGANVIGVRESLVNLCFDKFVGEKSFCISRANKLDNL